MNREAVVHLVLLCLVAFSGCTTAIRYVVVSDVPNSPSFTVIPASTSPDDDAAANWTVGQLVSLGVKVVERPALVRERSEFAGSSSGTGLGVTPSGQLAISGTSGSQQANLTTSVDPVVLIEQTKADYIIFAKPGPWLKVVRKSDGQILFASPLRVESSSGCCLAPSFWHAVQPESERLRNLLDSLGLLGRG